MNNRTETKSESMRTRVALHPFLAGMNRTELALLTDCADARSLQKRTNDFPGRRNGQPILFD